MAYLLIFLGGGLGSLGRYGLARWLASGSGTFPWATLLTNILSGLLIGLLVGLQQRGILRPTAAWLLITGFCGGFSTFSTFAYELVVLLQRQQPLNALIYLGTSVVLCLIMVYLGLKITG